MSPYSWFGNQRELVYLNKVSKQLIHNFLKKSFSCLNARLFKYLDSLRRFFLNSVPALKSKKILMATGVLLKCEEVNKANYIFSVLLA